jgi:arsenate reductase
MTIARRFERVSDQAKNICEEVLYMCTGEYAKHIGMDVFRILFQDEHNSCRSQIAEAIGNALDEPKLVFTSAGLEPRPVDAVTMKFMAEKGFDLSRQTPKALSQIPNLESYQVLVALAKGALSAFLVTPAKAVNLDWDVKDPSKVAGTPAEVRAAYEEAFQFIQAHIKDLAEAILGDDNPKAKNL